MTKNLQPDYKSTANEMQIKRRIIVQTFTKSSDIMIIIGDSHKRGEIKMKRKIIIVPDNIFIYMRFATREQASDSDTLILRKSEAIELYKDLQKMIFQVPFALPFGDVK